MARMYDYVNCFHCCLRQNGIGLLPTWGRYGSQMEIGQVTKKTGMDMGAPSQRITGNLREVLTEEKGSDLVRGNRTE